MNKLCWLRTLLIPLFATVCLSAQALEEKLVIVTSFPEDLTSVFQAAFEKQHPETKVEVLNKKTSAGVKYIQETAGTNTTDLFWVSAPDAFGVLKGKGLLQPYQPTSEGIPDLIGSFPINDPDRYFFGFAASGYGIMYNTRYLKAKRLPVPRSGTTSSSRSTSAMSACRHRPAREPPTSPSKRSCRVRVGTRAGPP